jgi:hypothetical protein
MDTIIQSDKTEFVPVVVDPPVLGTSHGNKTKSVSFFKSAKREYSIVASTDANSPQVTRADMIVARSQSFQADFSLCGVP